MIGKLDSQRDWEEAKKKYHLSDITIQMAKKLRLSRTSHFTLSNKWC